ncbi:MAG: helix-turn-helix domain containing protein [Candidatus Thermoplasmatota archaeon]|nr:helix-turn-helix domain containing protein [Candidatus Thermoplasmatota archaeon]
MKLSLVQKLRSEGYVRDIKHTIDILAELRSRLENEVAQLESASYKLTVLLKIAEGESVADVCAEFEKSKKAVYSWINALQRPKTYPTEIIPDEKLGELLSLTDALHISTIVAGFRTGPVGSLMGNVGKGRPRLLSEKDMGLVNEAFSKKFVLDRGLYKHRKVMIDIDALRELVKETTGKSLTNRQIRDVLRNHPYELRLIHECLKR